MESTSSEEKDFVYFKFEKDKDKDREKEKKNPKILKAEIKDVS